MMGFIPTSKPIFKDYNNLRLIHRYFMVKSALQRAYFSFTPYLLHVTLIQTLACGYSSIPYSMVKPPFIHVAF